MLPLPLILERNFYDLLSFRIQDMHHLLTYLLNTLNKIWTQSDWECRIMRCINYMSGVFANTEFRRTVRLLVKSFEKLICNRSVESPGAQKECASASSYDMYSYTLAKLLLPLVLRVNNYRKHFCFLTLIVMQQKLCPQIKMYFSFI